MRTRCTAAPLGPPACLLRADTRPPRAAAPTPRPAPAAHPRPARAPALPSGRAELESLSKGADLFHEAWLDAPFGTEDSPVEVTSEFSERIVGCADPDDDSIVWWGVIEEGQPPRQIVEGGEFFVLKKLPSSGGHH